MKKSIKIGSGSGFWGDALDPAIELLEKENLDYMGFDFLAELTMSLLQRQKAKNPSAGYVSDVVPYMKALMPLARKKNTTLISNGGGVNVKEAALGIISAAKELNLNDVRVGAVDGDDVLDQVRSWIASGIDLRHMETGETGIIDRIDDIVSANVYTDSTGIVEALEKGANVIVTGRVSDNALYVGPAAYEFGWDRSGKDSNPIAGAITLGHIVECAAGCTGGMSSRFSEMAMMGKVGFPFIEMFPNGDGIVSKADGTGGRVDINTVKEHLVYEIANPQQYIMPDGIADFTSLKLSDVGFNKVRVSDTTGNRPSETLKLVIGLRDGWIGESMAFFPWPNAYDRVLKAKQTMLERFERLELKATEIHFDIIGLNMLHGPAAIKVDPSEANKLPELGLRCAVKTHSAVEADKVRRAASSLWIMGPGGTSFGTPIKPRPVVKLWPTLIPKDSVKQSVTIYEV